MQEFVNHNVDIYKQGERLNNDDYLVEIVNEDTFLVAANKEELIQFLQTITAEHKQKKIRRNQYKTFGKMSYYNNRTIGFLTTKKQWLVSKLPRR